jgi:poly-gamma-glutamate capsule biosynthesis protein CapA/YwtB (metallophosphatase superfamily)
VHWGKEGFTGSTPKQERLGRRLIDWGADVVIGAHPHVLGPTEEYGGGVIHYSLGNFIGNLGSRKNVGLWEVRLEPGKRPVQESYLYAWDGTPLSANAKARERLALKAR